MYVCMCVCVCVCMYGCMYVRTYTHYYTIIRYNDIQIRGKSAAYFGLFGNLQGSINKEKYK